ncbi:MAG: hypothetical protein AB7I79_15955 [Rhizobiaceae bacterium]
MAEEPKPRPVSGEIMTGALPHGGRGRQADIVDAEFVSLPSAARTRPGTESTASPAAPAQGMATLIAPAGQTRPSRGGPMFWSFGVAFAACAFWVSGGHALVRPPEPAATMGARDAHGLRIVDVRHRVRESAAKRMLQVDGAAVNEGKYPRMLPGIEIAATGRDGRMTRYKLGTSDRPLQPGGRFDFSSRLEAPKDGLERVTVTFSEVSADAGRQGQGY